MEFTCGDSPCQIRELDMWLLSYTHDIFSPRVRCLCRAMQGGAECLAIEELI